MAENTTITPDVASLLNAMRYEWISDCTGIKVRRLGYIRKHPEKMTYEEGCLIRIAVSKLLSKSGETPEMSASGG